MERHFPSVLAGRHGDQFQRNPSRLGLIEDVGQGAKRLIGKAHQERGFITLGGNGRHSCRIALVVQIYQMSFEKRPINRHLEPAEPQGPVAVLVDLEQTAFEVGEEEPVSVAQADQRPGSRQRARNRDDGFGRRARFGPLGLGDAIGIRDRQPQWPDRHTPQISGLADASIR